MMQTDDPSSSGGINASGGRSSGFSGGHTEAELLARVQCSAAELKAALADRKALCIGGCLLLASGVCCLYACWASML
jgi:hypothetical protein